MHDAFGTYPKYTHATHALCHAHHLRELKGFIEQGHTWAMRMTTFLLAAKQAVKAHHGALSEEEARRWERVYDRILAKAQHRLETMTPLPKKHSLLFDAFKNERKKRCVSYVKYMFPLTTTKPNAIFAWLKSKRTFRVRFAKKHSPSLFVSQEASFPH
ncbi:hypothetical protein DI44_00515 [Geobacillus sp. CAMR5420]|nr:hypothetical protein DI44_00515 [Geobacillus sp. CAMR5420]